jgi:hypothetical protein
MSDRAGGHERTEPVSEERIAELEARIEELSAELREPPRGPLGLPRPPTPGELLAFVDDHAIPTTIAILEANVRGLKALRGTIGLLRRAEERDPGGRSTAIRDRTDSVAREAVAELDRAVSDLATAIEGGGLPDDRKARSVLQEIRSVRDEVADALEASGATEEDSGGSDAGKGESDDGRANERSDGGGGVEVDVESELESIRREMRGKGTTGDGDESEDGDGTSEDGGDSAESET